MHLAELAIGKRGRVTSIQGDDEISTRLLEMGLIPGTELAVLGAALWGDPIEIEVRGYRLSVRKSEGQRVEVEPLEPPR